MLESRAPKEENQRQNREVRLVRTLALEGWCLKARWIWLPNTRYVLHLIASLTIGPNLN